METQAQQVSELMAKSGEVTNTDYVINVNLPDWKGAPESGNEDSEAEAKKKQKVLIISLAVVLLVLIIIAVVAARRKRIENGL